MNDDLKPPPDMIVWPNITAQRAFTLAELVVLRYRDNHYAINSDSEHVLLTQVAELIGEIAKAWR